MILGLFFLSITFCLGQQKTGKQFILNGFVQCRDTGYIILRYTDYLGKWTTDTNYLQKGTFKFKGIIDEPVRATISGYSKIIDFDEANYTNLFLEPTVQKINLTENDYAHAKMYGSYTQKEFDTFKMHIDSIDAKYKDASHHLLSAKYVYQDAKTQTEKDQALQEERKWVDKLKLRRNETINEDISFALNHPDSYAIPFIFSIPAHELPIDSAVFLFKKLTLRIQNSLDGKWIANLLQKREQNTIGKMPYNFTAVDNAGNSISLSQFNDKYVYIDFWASWCVPCREAIPHLKKLYNKYHSKGFEIITISIDKDLSSWKKAIAQEQIANWHNLLVNTDITNNYENAHETIPNGMLIAPDGKIVWKSGRNKSLNDVLKSLIK